MGSFPMIILNRSLRDWHTAAFAATLKSELETVALSKLPLHNASTQGGLLDESTFVFRTVSD